MPQPTTSLATLRPDLASSLEEFDLAADAQGFIAHRVLPVVEVGKQAGTYGRIPIEQLLQTRDIDRAPGTGYSRGKWKFEKGVFACEERGAEEPIDDREREMYSEFFDAEMISAARALDVVLRNAEIRVADAVMNATTFTGLSTALAAPWSDKINSKPVDDVEAAIGSVYDQSGLMANTLITTWKTFLALRNNVQIIDRVKYSGHTDPRTRSITAEGLAQALGIEQVLVAGSTKNTAGEDKAAVLSQIWPQTMAIVCRVVDTPDFKQPTLGRTFHWSEDGSSVGGAIDSYRDETVRSDIVRVRHDVDEQILYKEAGRLLTNV